MKRRWYPQRTPTNNAATPATITTARNTPLLVSAMFTPPGSILPERSQASSIVATGRGHLGPVEDTADLVVGGTRGSRICDSHPAARRSFGEHQALLVIWRST